MIIQLEAKTYTSAAEMIEAGRLRRAKLFKGARKPIEQIEGPQPIETLYTGMAIYPPSFEPVAIKKTRKIPARPAKPEEPKTYDLHVQDWRTFTIRFAHNKHRFHIFVRCRDFGLTLEEIYGDRRFKRIVQARHLIIWELKTLYGMGYPMIGKLFGLDHTSILHAFRRVQAMVDRGEVESPLAGVHVARRG